MGYSSVGDFIKVTTFVSFFFLLVDFGLNSIFLRDHYHNAETLFGNLTVVRLLLAGLLFIFLVFCAVLLPFNPITGTGYSGIEKIGIVIYAVTLFTQAILLSLNAITQKYLLSKKLIFPDIMSVLVLLGLIVIGISEQKLLIIFIAYPISEVVNATLSLHAIHRVRRLALKSQNLRLFSKKLMAASFPLALMLFLNVIFFRADTLLLTFMRSSTEVGVYGVSYKVFEFLIVFPTFFTASVYAILIQKKDSFIEFKNMIRHYSFILFGIAIVGTIATYLCAPLLLLIKPDFVKSVIPLQILAFSLPFFFLTSLFQWVYILKSKMKFLLLTYGVSMIINILLNVIFIPTYSYYASAVITIVSEGIVLLIMILYFLFLSREKYEKRIGKSR